MKAVDSRARIGSTLLVGQPIRCLKVSALAHLERDSSVPLYQQLADHLLQDIAEGRLPTGVAFPWERQLMGRYQVTRTTVRSTIGLLTQEGMVVGRPDTLEIRGYLTQPS